MKPLVFLARPDPAAWVPPTAKVLAYLHGGRIFTDTLPWLARIALLAVGSLFALWWIVACGFIYRDYERWSLVAAMLVHFGFLVLAYLFGRIAWLRIDHLSKLPAGDDVALRSLPILLRATAELFFVFVVAASLRAFAMPAPPPPPVTGSSGLFEQLGAAVPNPMAWMGFGAWMTVWFAFYALFGVIVLYGFANAIELSMAIERNTRKDRRRRETHGEHSVAVGE